GFCAGHIGSYFDPVLEHNAGTIETNGFITDVLTDKAMAWIEANRNQKFFCYIPYNAPHTPYQVPDNYYEKYKQQFLDYRLGLPGIREYPKGQKGRGDIDSGPVILGIGGAASIVGQQVFGKKEDFKVYEGLRNSIELFGVGSRSQNKKRYIFGELPIADAFICWSNSIENKGKIFKSSEKWRWQYQLISVFAMMLLSYLILKI
ncbi:MAG: sulfatase-like hydrolase/transferase, partial [Bacteroidota bacterium]